MPIFGRVAERWQRAKEFAVTQELSAETALIVNQYAEDAYRFCISLFGPPSDPRRRYKFLTGERSFCTIASGVYTIVLSRHTTSKEEICGVIAHEMCHRVTANRKGLCSEMWIEELTATLASLWFLEHQGFKDCVERGRANWLKETDKADVSSLRDSSRGTQNYILTGTPIYSEVFAKSLWRICYALRNALRIKDLASLTSANDLEDWIISLPSEDQYVACCVFGLPTAGKTVPQAARETGKLFHALEAMGDKEALVAEFEDIAALQPENGEVLFYLGYAHHQAKHFDEALSAYAKSRDLSYLNKWLNHNIGGVYWRMENYTIAAEWFQKAVEQTPDWARALYFLGRSQHKLGNLEAARENWEKAQTLSDEHYAQLSTKALQENLPPATAEEVSEPN